MDTGRTFKPNDRQQGTYYLVPPVEATGGGGPRSKNMVFDVLYLTYIFAHKNQKNIFLLKLIRGTQLQSLGPLPCMVFSKNVPKVVLRYRDLKFAHV